MLEMMRQKPWNRDQVGGDRYGMWYDPQTVVRERDKQKPGTNI